MEEKVTQVENSTEEEINFSKEAFNQRLKQAERAGVRSFLKEAGLTSETTADQIKALLNHAKEASEAADGTDAHQFQLRIEALEKHIESLEAQKQAELTKERKLREEIVIRESLTRAYLENNGITAEISPHAQETALRDMLNMQDVTFQVTEDNSVVIASADGTPVYQDGKPISLNQWVRNYLEQRPYLVRSSANGPGIDALKGSLANSSTSEIRVSGSDRSQRLALGRNL